MVGDKDLREALLSRGYVHLHCQEGGSDKMYDIQLAASSDGVTVKVSYGRRGGNQKVETKTPEGPVTQDAALKIAVSLLKSKIRGGYRPVDAGEKEPSTIMQAIEAVDTGLRPQLLSAVGDDPFEVADLLNSPVHAAQEKMDGERRMLMVGTALEVVGANRRGIAVPVPDGLSREVLAIGRLVTLDGEAMGEEFWAFDLLSLDGEDLRNSSFERRVALLQNLPFEGFSLKRCATAWTPDAKKALMERITAEGGEGIVFKDRFSSYAPGRNVDHLKFKFWHSLSALVIGVNQGKRSVAIGLLDDVGEVTPVGSVTVPANLGIPTAGSIIEVRYLYAYRGGSLFQPTLIGPRTDLLREDCKIAQVHYKAGVADELDNAA